MMETRSYLLWWLAIFVLSVMCARAGSWSYEQGLGAWAIFVAVFGTVMAYQAFQGLIKAFRARLVGRTIRKLAERHRVETPKWRVLPNSFNPLRGRFFHDEKRCSIEFYGIPDRHTIEHEFEHYLDWRRGELREFGRCLKCGDEFKVEPLPPEVVKRCFLCPACRKRQ